MAQNYVIGSGLTESQLKTASWWVRHKIALRRTGFISLIVLVVGLWGYSAWSLLDAYVISYPREKAIPQFIRDNEVALQTLQATAPKNIQTFDPFIFQNTDNRQDFLVQISNPNTQWWAEFTYRFDVGGDSTPVKKGYILPNSQRELTELGWKGTAVARTATLVVDNIVWHRIDPTKVERDYAAFRDKRWKLTFDNLAYTHDLQFDSQTIGRTTFTLNNPTGFGFWDVDLTVILYRLDRPVAVTTINVREIKPNESRPMTINWFENPTAISKTEVFPSVNLLDPDVYLPSDRLTGPPAAPTATTTTNVGG